MIPVAVQTDPPPVVPDPIQQVNQFAVDEQFNQQLHDHEDAISKNIEDQKELTNSLRELFDKINSQGVDALAQQLTDSGNFEVAEKVENFVEAEADPNIEFEESLNIQDIQEVQSEVEQIIQENPEFEAEEPADGGFNFEPEIPNIEAAVPDLNNMDFGVQEPDAEPAGFEAEPANLGLEAPSDNYGESNIDAGLDAEPAADMYGAEAEPEGELGDEFPEVAPDDGDGGYDDGGGGGETGEETDADLSKNSERPIGESQDLQSQWASPASDGILSNGADAFIPQVSRELNDMTIDQTLSLASNIDPLHPVHEDMVNAGSDSTDGRLDVHEDNEPYNDYGNVNYGNQYNRYK